MKFVIARDALLKPFSLVAGVVERRQTMPILANVLLVLKDDWLSLTGTDLEVELVGRVKLETPAKALEVTLPARKLLEICNALPPGCDISFSVEENRVVIRSGSARFSIASLPAEGFPRIEDSIGTHKITLLQGQLRRLIDRTAFAMAQLDVRYYLNGMLWELTPKRLRVVATDGHRLGMCSLESKFQIKDTLQVILPRKGAVELGRLLQDDSEEIALVLGDNHMRATTQEFTFTSKLVDGKFPDYERVLPSKPDRTVVAPREELRQALARTAILSNEKYRGVKLLLSDKNIDIVATNPEQEQAEEKVAVEYAGESLEIGFNVTYLTDILAVLSGEQIRLSLSGPDGSARLEESEEGDSLYVVMPMRI